MSLRRLTRILGVIVAGLTTVAATELIVITTYLDRLTAQIGVNMESVRAAEEIELQLLWHSRASLLNRQGGDSRYGNRQREALEGIERWQEIAFQHVGEPDEERVLRDLIAKIGIYLAQHQRLSDAGGTPLDVYTQSAAFLLDAYDAAEQLIDTNVKQAYAAKSQASGWNSLANASGSAVIAMLVVGIGSTLMASERRLYRPLFELRETIVSFTNSGGGLRAREEGPTELREIAHAFNEMMAAIETHRHDQLSFLAGVAHDLRNPLGAMKMAINTIPPYDPDAPRGHLEFTLKMLDRQVDVLARMITDLLDASRIEAGQFEIRIEECDARTLAGHAADLFRSSSARHEVITRMPDEPVRLRCDPARIEQVLNNLVSNAIKYSPAGGKVEVSVERNGPEAILSVRDQGLGIRLEEQDQIFQPFRRGDMSRDAIPGVGLGLSVARRIVEAHGGTITVDSSPGRGSTFSIRLPLAVAHAPLFRQNAEGVRKG